MTYLIIGLVISMIFSAFFSGMEIAFVASNRMLAEMDREKHALSQKAISLFYQHPSNFVSTMLVGNNIALVIYGILFAQIFDATLFSGLSDGFRVTADTLLSTVVVLFTGEFLPKMVFKNNPNTMLTIFALPAFLCYVILYPISRFATFLSKCMLALVGVKMRTSEEDKEFTKVDLDYLVQSSLDNATDKDNIDEEVRIFHNALDFSDTKVRDCMVPRTEIDAEDWVKCIRTMPFVPETMPAQKMMQTFLQQKKTLGVVVDEFGGTSGLVALEDIVEEIFGEIEDEHDSTNYIAQRLENGEYLLSARLEIEKINEMFDLGLPESDEYMTLGGLILHEYQSFPKLNEVVTIGKFEFKIIKNTMTKIELVRLKVAE